MAVTSCIQFKNCEDQQTDDLTRSQTDIHLDWDHILLFVVMWGEALPLWYYNPVCTVHSIICYITVSLCYVTMVPFFDISDILILDITTDVM